MVNLFAMMIAAVTWLTNLSEACKKKLNTLFKKYKCNKMDNEVYEESRHECKFYDSIDQW